MNSTPHAIKLATITVLAAVAGAWWAGCNQHPVEFSRGSGAVEHVDEISATNETLLDMLWVIDNSGSMCEEQEELRNEFKAFLQQLSDRPINFHMAVTTTHFNPDYSFEKVAEPGHIQSTPHPLVGANPQCQCANPNDSGTCDSVEGDAESDAKYTGKYAPLRYQIEAAVKCAKGFTTDPANFPEELESIWDPQAGRVGWSQEDMACALEGESCADASTTSGNVAALFPCGQKKGLEDSTCDKSQLDDVYRDIPKVLQASDYRNENGSLDIDRFKRDFQCMSYVGTRGGFNEQGLHAAVRAVSPRMTGGPAGDPIENPKTVRKEGEDWSYPDDDPTEAPNHGFLRKDANTAVIFVTDENDCSLPEGTSLDSRYDCGEMNCYYAAKETRNSDGPLYTTAELTDKFLANLAASKKVGEVSKEDIVMASIHGVSDPGMTGEIKNQCDPGQGSSIFNDIKVCDTSLGTARSGDRYEDFLLNFDRTVPERGSGSGSSQLDGYMCSSDGFADALGEVAGEIETDAGACIGEYVSCSQSSSCPAFEHGPQGGTCQKWPAEGVSGETKYCKSAMQVRLRYDGSSEDAAEALGSLGACYSETVGPETPNPKSCVVNRDAYEWTTCNGDDTKVSLSWEQQTFSNPARQLAGFTVQLHYTEITGGDSGGSSDAGSAGGG